MFRNEYLAESTLLRIELELILLFEQDLFRIRNQHMLDTCRCVILSGVVDVGRSNSILLFELTSRRFKITAVTTYDPLIAVSIRTLRACRPHREFACRNIEPINASILR